jgi:cytochrome c-type biogenesis protein CcsB
MKALYKILPWLFLALFATEIIVVLIPKSDKEFHTAEFGRLPVLLNGRIQPLDSVARNSLLQIRSTGDVPLEEVPSWKFWVHPAKLKSTDWLLEVFFKPDKADNRPIFLIHHPDLISELKLAERGIEKSGLHYYSYAELAPVLDEIDAQGRKASAIQEDSQRTAYQKQVLKLANAVMLYQRLKNSIQPEATTDFVKLLADYKAAVPAGLAAIRDQQTGPKVDTEELKTLADILQQVEVVAKFAYPLVVPPLNPSDKDAWANVGTNMRGAIQGGTISPAVGFYAQMATGYSHGDADEFNQAVSAYENWLEPDFRREVAKGRAEYYFNQIKIFLHATIIYLVAFILAGAALLTFALAPGLSESLRSSAFYLIVLAFIVHTFGLLFRMMLEGRPPVTNLYSSAIFIGWGACALGLVLERLYKLGLGSAVAGLAGFVTLLIAHNLALGGDTMEMLRAVLDTNVWLATHVVVVTLGYASTFVAGTLALSYVVLGVFTPLLTTKVGAVAAGKKTGDITLGRALGNMVYAIVCFATLFSFVGTVLGGIWADQSWGRFWGWDPKENGALLIVIWNALILHARWGGLVRERGLMNLAIFGNIVTAFSWFGVNMLGIGLHSYGFMDAAFKWLVGFEVSQVLLILLGLLPLRFWKSYQNVATQKIAPPDAFGGKKVTPSPARA